MTVLFEETPFQAETHKVTQLARGTGEMYVRVTDSY